MRVDLHRQTPHTEHYLPDCCAIDFEVYQNKNFTPDALHALKRDLTLGSLGRGGMRATHTVPNLVREMDELGIAQSVLLPIELPYISRNAAHALEAARRQPRLVPFGSVHPIVDRVGERLDDQAHGGARGVKMHPAVQLMAPNHPRAMALYRQCGERDLPVLWHCGPVGIELQSGRRRSQVSLYEEPIASHPRTRFVLGHAGALQMEQALDLACRYPNVWLELSGQSLSNVRTILDSRRSRSRRLRQRLAVLPPGDRHREGAAGDGRTRGVAAQGLVRKRGDAAGACSAQCSGGL